MNINKIKSLSGPTESKRESAFLDKKNKIRVRVFVNNVHLIW